MSNRSIQMHNFLRVRVTFGVRTVAFPPWVGAGIPSFWCLCISGMEKKCDDKKQLK